MEDVSPVRLWMYRASFVAVGMLLILWSIIPFDLSAGAMPVPDLFYCITMVYVVRRPEYVPIWAVFFVFFMRDVLTQAPLGLFTLLMVMGTEVVRANIQAFREYIFGLEWLWMATIFVAITLIQQVLLALTLSDTPRFLEQVLLILFTVMTYPVTVGAIKYGLGITRPRPGELDAWGKRL
jgi:rod shape-determining protein MreD